MLVIPLETQSFILFFYNAEIKTPLQTLTRTKKETWGFSTLNCEDQIQMYIALLLLTSTLNQVLHEILILKTGQNGPSYGRATFLLQILPILRFLHQEVS